MTEIFQWLMRMIFGPTNIVTYKVLLTSRQNVLTAETELSICTLLLQQTHQLIKTLYSQ